jgi:hypothetical protein
MKKILLIASLSIVGLASCSKIVGMLVSKIMSMQTVDAQFTLPIVTDTTNTNSYGPATATVNVDSFITAYSSNNYNIKNLKSANIESCNITISNPDDKNNFANIQSCEVDLNSDVNKTIIHPATITNNPDTYSASLDVPVDNTIDLTSYMNAKQFNYTIKAKLRRATTKELTCTIHIKMHIEMQ